MEHMRVEGQKHTSSILISEVFGPTIQGEGALMGMPTVFVRTGGCDYRCHWCDTPYAVLPVYKHEWHPWSTEEIFEHIQTLSQHTPLLVTLSGGNPALQPLEQLLNLGHAYGYTFALETQGSSAQIWFAKLDHLVLSPKPPSSKQVTRWGRLDQCIAAALQQQDERKTHISLKVVVFDEDDYHYATDVAKRYPDIPLYVQAGNHTPAQDTLDLRGIVDRMDWLVERVISDHQYRVTILPQLHVLLWGNKRGV